MEEGTESRPAQTEDWRRRFISLAEDVGMLCGEPAAAIDDDPDNYLLMQVPVAGRLLDVLHFPDQGERFVVHCRLGPVPDGHEPGILKAALATNMPLTFQRAGMFVLDVDANELIYSTAESLRDLTATQLMQNLSAMASVTGAWMEANAQLSV